MVLGNHKKLTEKLENVRLKKGTVDPWEIWWYS